jgi:hypothetical protein
MGVVVIPREGSKPAATRLEKLVIGRPWIRTPGNYFWGPRNILCAILVSCFFIVISTHKFDSNKETPNILCANNIIEFEFIAIRIIIRIRGFV